ncbi:hypothetical protein AVEN_35199-1 [Araneus ventricosus]|uniref:Uncharacterized protein n=1 Tax=Araneus ventricosus TaxID=182803 RepID=A0A4Y2K4L8_ARAVE|nr:hypothetical protein AVEN_35199-1 [Araneus ventricosus]
MIQGCQGLLDTARCESEIGEQCHLLSDAKFIVFVASAALKGNVDSTSACLKLKCRKIVNNDGRDGDIDDPRAVPLPGMQSVMTDGLFNGKNMSKEKQFYLFISTYS